MKMLWLSRPVHVSWLIAWCSVGIIMGVIGSAHITQGAFADWIWFVLGVALFLVGCYFQRRWAVTLLLVAGLLIGVWRGSATRHDLTMYAHVIGKTLTLSGKIVEDPDVDKKGMPTLRLNEISVDGHQLPGKIWVSITSKHSNAQRSDIVTVRGKLNQGFANFSGAMYRASVIKVQRPIPGDVALQARDSFAREVRESIRDPAASLGLGYLVGQRRALPSDLHTALQVAGLMHVVVASGYNLTILVRLARRLFVRISKFLSACSAGLLIISFIAVTGASPSMSRAGLVAFLSLAAWYYGHKFHPLVLLPFAAAITLLFNPSYGWNDLGWILSFAAFGGVMIVAPLLQRYFFGDKKPGTIRQIIGETISAQLATLPLLVMAFGIFSVVALFANILVLPLVPLAMLLTFATGIGMWLVPPIGQLIGLPTQFLLDYMIAAAQYFAKLPWAQIEMKLLPIGVLTYYVIIVAACVWMWRATKFSLRDQNLVE